MNPKETTGCMALHLPSAEWKISNGTHNGKNFRVEHPADWELHTLPTAGIVACQKDPNALVSFIWTGGLGAMAPDDLLRSTVQYNNINDYEIIHTEPIRTVNTPLILFRFLEQDSQFTYHGERCRAHIAVQLTDGVLPSISWGGSIIWEQAPVTRWEKYKSVTNRIAASFVIASNA